MATRKPPRQMAAKACERCRRRKIKCDEFFPCGQCTRMRVACKIEDPAEKRREQQQSAMEDRIKRLEALLIATYTNPNNHIDMNMPGLDQEGLISSPTGGGSPGQTSSPGVKLEPPRLTLQTPASPEFRQPESNELLSAGDYSFGFPYWSPPPSVAPSAPGSASDYFGPHDWPPWSTTVTTGGSGDTTPPVNSSRIGRRTRASSMSTSETSTQDELVGSPTIHERNVFSIDTSGSTLDIPQIEVTSWDQSRPQSPALSPASLMDMDTSPYYPPELSIGSWSGLSSPAIIAQTYPFEDNLLGVNQSLPSHSRRSSINSLSPDCEVFNEPKRRRAASDVFPVPQQFIYPERDPAEFFYDKTPRPTTPSLQQQTLHDPTHSSQTLRQEPNTPGLSQAKDDLYNRTFLEVIHPLFPILSPQNMPGYLSQNFSQSPTSTPRNSQSWLSPSIAQTQSYLTRAISAHILSMRSGQATLPAQNYFNLGLRSHGAGKWDSLPGIQSGILLAIFILVSGCHGPNLYILNSSIVAACFDLGLHRGGLSAGSLEANTLFAAYVLDRTVALVKVRPCLLKDEDLEAGTLKLVKAQLREKAERGHVRRWPEGGRLWEWWASFEDNLRAGEFGADISAELAQNQHHQQIEFGFGEL